MKRTLKVLLGIFILLIIIAIGFAVTFDANNYKKELVNLVKEKTGRTLTINGDISLSFFPWIGVELGEIKINNAKNFGNQDFAKISRLQVRAKLWPLFSQKIEADTLVIEGLTLNLAKNKQGKSNWDDFTRTRTGPSVSKSTGTQHKPISTPNTNALALFAINGVTLKNATFHWQQQKQKISVNNIQLNIGKIRVGTKVPVNLQFQLQEKSLDALVKLKSDVLFSSDLKNLSFYNVELLSDVTLASLKNTLSPKINSAVMQFNLENKTFKTEQLNFSEGEFKLQAKIKSNTKTSSTKIFIDKINLDRYLAGMIKTENKSTATATTTKIRSTNHREAILIPLALLNSINVDADIKINKIQFKNTHWKNLHLIARSKNGNIKISPLEMQGYDAVIKSNFYIKAKKNTALLSGNINIKNINAGQLLNDLTGKDKLKGKTSLAVKFSTQGIKLSQLKQNLNGTLNLNLQNGTLKGFDIDHQQKVFKAKINRQAIPKAPQPVETKIANLSASAIIKNGILTNKDLRAATPLARIIGSGMVNIPKEKINYVATVKFTSSTKIKTSTTFEKMNTLPLDIKITGNFDKLRFKADFNKALNVLLKKELKKQEVKIKDKAKKDIQKELEKRLGDKLKNLFKF